MVGNIGKTMVKGYDSMGNSDWYESGIFPPGVSLYPPEDQPEVKIAPEPKVTPPKRPAIIPDPKK